MTPAKNLTKIIYNSQEAKKELMINTTKGEVLQRKIDTLCSISILFTLGGFLCSFIIGVLVGKYIFNYLEKVDSSLSLLFAMLLGGAVFLVLVHFCFFASTKADKKSDSYKEKIKLSDNARYCEFLNKYEPDEFEVVKNIKIDRNKIIVLEENPLYNKFKFKDKYTVVQTDRCFDVIDLTEKRIYAKHELNTCNCAECRQPC